MPMPKPLNMHEERKQKIGEMAIEVYRVAFLTVISALI
jgi:hypothetical protein